MALKTADDLFVDELKDIYSAEKQAVRVPPRMTKSVELQELIGVNKPALAGSEEQETDKEDDEDEEDEEELEEDEEDMDLDEDDEDEEDEELDDDEEDEEDADNDDDIPAPKLPAKGKEGNK